MRSIFSGLVFFSVLFLSTQQDLHANSNERDLNAIRSLLVENFHQNWASTVEAGRCESPKFNLRVFQELDDGQTRTYGTLDYQCVDGEKFQASETCEFKNNSAVWTIEYCDF